MTTLLRRFFHPALLALALAPALVRAGQPAAPITSDRLVAELTSALSSHFAVEGDLEIELLRAWTPPAKTASSWQVVVTEFPPILSSNIFLRCRVLADGAVAEDVTLMMRAALWRDVWYARQPLTNGSRFNPGLLDARRSDTLRQRDGLPASVGDLSLMFARDVAPDRMLTWHDVARRPLVRKGEMVEVVASEGELSLSMKALALQAGARGDLITVRNMESLKDISGLVVDDHRVEVHF